MCPYAVADTPSNHYPPFTTIHSISQFNSRSFTYLSTTYFHVLLGLPMTIGTNISKYYNDNVTAHFQ